MQFGAGALCGPAFQAFDLESTTGGSLYDG